MTRPASQRRKRPAEGAGQAALRSAGERQEPSPLASVLTRRALRRLAGERAFERGAAYCAGGQVRALDEHEGALAATVRGTRDYRVKLWAEGGDLAYACTCPVGADGVFCKHGVAAGLAWLEQAAAAGEPAAKPALKPAVTMDDVRAWLAAQDKAALVDLLVARAMDDDRLRRRLLVKAAQAGPRGPDLAALREAIDRAVDPGELVDYGAVHDYAQGIEEMIGSLEGLLEGGRAVEVVELAEHALTAVEAAIESVDDSDGFMGGLLERLQALHHAACRKARPDPETLARRLLEWELRSGYDVFHGAAAAYADILGEKGLAAYRRLAEAEWARMPALGPGGDDPERWGRRFRITRVMETLARLSGDVEALVAVKRRDLSSPCAYLEIAELYRRARKPDQALAWAEQGVKAFPEQTDPRLRAFLAGEYHRRGRHDDAMTLVWADFTDEPGLEAYRHLKAHARRLGQWPAWRERALACLREAIAGPARRGAGRGTGRGAPRDPRARAARADRSELVRIFLWEKDVEAAWREAAEGGCSDDLWLALAAAREKTHPEDALAVYRRRLEPTLARANPDAYREAIGLLRKVRELLARAGRKAEFPRYLEAIRTAHRRKRSFIRLLDRARWA